MDRRLNRSRRLGLAACLLAVGVALTGCAGSGQAPSGVPGAAGSTRTAAGTPPTASPSSPGASTGQQHARRYPLVGVQFQGTWSTYTDAARRQLLDDLVRTGVRTVRIGVSWAMIQPTQPRPGDPGWSWSWGIPRVDSVIAMARARGLIVHATFGRTPAWANGGAGEAAPPTSLADWRRAVRFVARRYAGKVSSWEVWNEPNLAKFFTPASPSAYTKLLCAAYPAVKREAPSTPVVFGGVSGNDWKFVAGAFRAGAKGCFDVLAVHPYQRWGLPPGAPAPDAEPWYFSNVTRVRAVEERYGDPKPIWFTEIGWSTHANTPTMPEYERGVSRARQASYLVRMLEVTQRRYPYVARVYIYQARDETGFDVENNNFGLFTTRLTPKPAVAALRRYLRGR